MKQTVKTVGKLYSLTLCKLRERECGGFDRKHRGTATLLASQHEGRTNETERKKYQPLCTIISSTTTQSSTEQRKHTCIPQIKLHFQLLS